ncbi:glycosyltransferase family 2 protein [Methylobacterium nigriterrae]|uniref:glycosyltransferase family 2 protein n=1 Tax=Methylobacterium nigriterrae TaxID=3127512 RepID=UPI003013AA20
MIVIPVYKQPQFLAEAVTSALGQTPSIDCRVVIVDDGCPMPETQSLGLALALANPCVRYVRTRNRGLSAARNAGVTYALSVWPELQAFYMLDADNRLTPRSVERGFAVLAAHPDISWVYPQLNKFGMTWSGHVAVPASPLHILLAGSFMEASSLIHRRVFDAGLRYDETLRAGFEDWEFWLQAFARGFHGTYLPEMGLDYRYRPESMVRVAARQRQALVGELRRRHPVLYTARGMLAFEQSHHPRYACIGEESLTYFTDPMGAVTQAARPAFTEYLWRALVEPERTGLPPYLLWLTPSAMSILVTAKLIQGALWRLEAAADAGGGLAGLWLSVGANMAFDEAVSREDAPAAILIQTPLFAQSIADSAARAAEFDALLKNMPRVGLTLPADLASVDDRPASAATSVQKTFQNCRSEREGWEKPARWHWQTITLPDSRELVETLRSEIGGAPLSNVVRENAIPTYCLVTEHDPDEVVSAAEALACGQAMEHVQLHLVAVGNSNNPDASVLRRVHSLDFLTLPQSGQHGFRFLGQAFDLPPPNDRPWQQVRGVLAGFDTIIVTVPRLFPLLAEWRAHGTRTIVLQPSTGWKRSENRLILAFEHATDNLLVTTDDDARWLTGHGYPTSKIEVLPGLGRRPPVTKRP